MFFRKHNLQSLEFSNAPQSIAEVRSVKREPVGRLSGTLPPKKDDGVQTLLFSLRPESQNTAQEIATPLKELLACPKKNWSISGSCCNTFLVS